MRSRLRFIAVVSAAALYAAVAMLGQGLHSFACPHDAHECHASDRAGDGLHSGHSANEHDADSCPICQASAQAHAVPIKAAATGSTLCLRQPLIACDRLSRSPSFRPYLARGPPAA
jgi:hypothetical protein